MSLQMKRPVWIDRRSTIGTRSARPTVKRALVASGYSPHTKFVKTLASDGVIVVKNFCIAFQRSGGTLV